MQTEHSTITPARPSWLRVRAPNGANYLHLKRLISSKHLNTVCFSAACPNIGHCWERKTATFMIMGNTCTRSCRFCQVDSSSRPMPLDQSEPQRLANTINAMGLEHSIITSVTRDDLVDGGANHFASCIGEIKKLNPKTTIEVLTPDFKGSKASMETLLKAKPDVFNHNLETVETLTPKIRSGGSYKRSLGVLTCAKNIDPNMKTKSGLMLGLGEKITQVKQAISDLRENNVDFLTIGQYLRPSKFHHPVVRYAHPNEFVELAVFAKNLGFLHVESGPLVRSSYHADKALEQLYRRVPRR